MERTPIAPRPYEIFKPLNLGIIGYGAHSREHLDEYGDDFITYTVWDPNVCARTETNSQTVEELLEYPQIDAVLIASPERFHLDQSMAALSAGKHVFCEKPLVEPSGEGVEFDMANLSSAFALARDKELVLSTCHLRRFDRPVMWLKQNLLALEKRLGKVMSFDFDFSYHEPVSQWKHGRSLLLDHVNHEIDLANHLFGIEGFEAMKQHDGPDRYDVVGKRDDGIIFHFQGTRRLKKFNYPEWCRVRFERGGVELDMMKGRASISDHERKTIKTVPKLGIDYDGRLKRVMHAFRAEIAGYPGYLTESEMLMNTETGLALQEEGLQRVNIRS